MARSKQYDAPGRPMGERGLAKAAGKKTYNGKTCTVCHSMARYVSSGGCVSCAMSRYADPYKAGIKAEAKAQWMTALSEGRKTYDGQPCKRCSHTTRYTSSKNCVTCSTLAARSFRIQLAEVFHNDHGLLVTINATPHPDTQHLYMQCPEHNQGTYIVWSDCKRMAPAGMRLYTGHDVLQRPELLQLLLNQCARLEQQRVPREQWHTDLQIAWTLRNAYSAAMRGLNQRFANNGKRT